jgi:chitosanase
MNDLQKATAEAIVNVFETGRVRGRYGAVAVLKGDSGHLTYGRSQTTLGSGGLFELVQQYCGEPNAKFAVALTPFLNQLQQRDVSLDNDQKLRAILAQAGDDPVMRITQDQFFTAHFLAPACRDAESVGIMSALGQTVVYDSHVQGGWGKLQARLGPVNQRGEKDWVKSFVDLRRTWLLSLQPPLPSTVYRMQSFADLIVQDRWDLALPLTVHNITITEAALQGDDKAITGAKRTLQLEKPYLRGQDVVDLQKQLAAKGFANSADGVYGPFTDALVKQWQSTQGISGEDSVVGPKTLSSLGL